MVHEAEVLDMLSTMAKIHGYKYAALSDEYIAFSDDKMVWDKEAEKWGSEYDRPGCPCTDGICTYMTSILGAEDYQHTLVEVDEYETYGGHDDKLHT